MNDDDIEIEAEALARAQYQFEQEQSPSLASKVWGDIKETPAAVFGAIKEIPAGLGNIYDSLFSPVESLKSGTTEKTIRGIGTLAAGTAGGLAGATTGAALGAPLAPFTFGLSVPAGAVLGGAAGGALGLYDYNKLNQLVGNNAVSTPEQDAEQFRKNLVQGVVLGTAAKAASAGTGALAGKLKSGMQKEVLGYNPEAAQKIAGVLDDTGAVTQDASNAGPIVTKKDIALNNLEESGFFTKVKATDTSASLTKKLWQHQQEAGKTIGGIIDDLAPKEAELLSSTELAPWQKASITSAAPTFENATALIDDVSIANKSFGRRLSRQLNSIKEAWQDSPQDLKALKNIQEKFGIVNKKSFNPKASTIESLSDDLNNAIYGDLAESVKGRIKALDPAAATKFEQANKQYSSASTFKQSAFDASRKSTGSALKNELFSITGRGGGMTAFSSAAAYANPLFAAPFLAERALTIAKTAAPVQTLKAASGVQALMEMFSKAASKSAPLAAITNGEPSSNEQRIIPMPEKKEDIEAKILANPTDAAIYEMESASGKKLKNPTSSAKGAFQLIDSTAKKLGVKNVMDLEDNYNGYLKLKQENIDRFGTDDPELVYSAHYLGAPLLEKVLQKKPLSPNEQKIVDGWERLVMPRFRRVYSQMLEKQKTMSV